jgi:hypothetical protein
MQSLLETDPVTLCFLLALAWGSWGLMFSLGKAFFWVNEGIEARELYKRCRLDSLMSLLRVERLMDEFKAARSHA